MSNPSTARLEARISPDLHALIKRAAEMQGRTLTDFVVSAVTDAAQNAIEKTQLVRLTLEDQMCFADAFVNPPLPNEALVKAFAKRKSIFEA